jgi:hypothetical protein
MSATDVITNKFDIGSIVNVPMVVTAIGATSQVGVPILGLTTKYKTPDGSVAISVATIYATQVILDK